MKHSGILCPPGHVLLGGGPRVDPGHTGETTSLGWFGNTSVFPLGEMEKVAGERKVLVTLFRLLPP